jgi:hypothetical protein
MIDNERINNERLRALTKLKDLQASYFRAVEDGMEHHAGLIMIRIERVGKVLASLMADAHSDEEE